MHPAWFRIGGVAHDLPTGWERLVRDFVDWLPKRLDEYEKAAMRNGILRARTIGVAQYNTAAALAWGVTGAGLRATGLGFDLRKARPYSGYENFDFEVPVAAQRRCLRPLRWCVSKRCARACASSSSASKTCRPAPTRRIIR
jgi:NADH-quinone oxidoreductase subunit C/D